MAYITVVHALCDSPYSQGPLWRISRLYTSYVTLQFHKDRRISGLYTTARALVFFLSLSSIHQVQRLIQRLSPSALGSETSHSFAFSSTSTDFLFYFYILNQRINETPRFFKIFPPFLFAFLFSCFFFLYGFKKEAKTRQLLREKKEWKKDEKK